MTRVLVSGGTGFVGRFIVEHLMAAGYDVVAGGRTPPAPAFFSKPVAFVPLALDPDIDQSVAFRDVDHFVHAAFQHVAGRYRGGEGDDPEGFRRSNLDGSVRLFRTARDHGVKRCVFLSSRAVYGDQLPGVELFEDTACHPESLYGSLKLEAENALAALGTNAFKAVSLRVTGVYGPSGTGAAHKWQPLFDDYLAGREIAPRAGTEVHGDDVAAAVRLTLEAPLDGLTSGVFNVSDVLVDNCTILAMVQDITGSKHALPRPATLTTFNAMNSEKIRAVDWRPGGLERLRATVRTLLA
ncbi:MULTISPECIES: NAD(P)-dependent oxidoreductase [unclassified Ensifer]|uniref:NAD-dependent epimerase/dehydratase family protein n=1 Tax=Ensifer TaxID=106591 RepID=UPI000710F735|nr:MULTISPECIES: NAD(P)-dependent oxidoreductase [unclassified Ensifer]KQW39701.1 UDP-glucose 4-epimerase [Ensifer sp. Root1252]KQY60921.1 UDP-glucose 4-epimerase [Ensifer sp. Root142]KRC60198.1 UDP-glucose 4-epimerase [Ensifer sp. Root231]KRC90598.1 UDP-glucose 4-epimerase [Ensifer sp. Root258]OMQ45554.1 UDP-glucose 4-epimerase [Ensifer sp. 1H6]